MSTADDLGTALCTRCGLCCSGVVLSGVLVQNDERSFAKRHRLVLVDTPVGAAFAHPCPVLDGTKCGDYAGRPRACRKFACKLLRAVEDGERSLDEAVLAATAMVQDARSIEGRIESGARSRMWQLAGLAADPATPTATRSAAEDELGALLPDLAALRARVNELIVSPEENAANRAERPDTTDGVEEL